LMVQFCSRYFVLLAVSRTTLAGDKAFIGPQDGGATSTFT
jgi:hypothetical protein